MSSNDSNPDKSVRSTFIPTTHSFSKQKSNHQLLPTIPPGITSLLYSVFPFLVILDKFLSFLTWTNSDPHFNFLIIAGYTMIVIHWEIVSLIFFPSLMVLIVSSLFWFVKTVVEDCQNNEEYSPTMEEIMDTLSNITLRFQFYLKPAQVFVKMKFDDKVKLFISLVLLSPAYIYIMRSIFSTKSTLLILGTLILTYNSSWFIAGRNILWRSVTIRKFAMLLTGLEFSLVDKSLEISYLTDFKVIEQRGTGTPNPKVVPNTKILEFSVIENQRRWIGIGWSNIMLPFERSSFTNEKLVECCSDLSSFKFPVIPNIADENCKWKWLEENWKIDQKFNDYNDAQGWIYYGKNWDDATYMDSLTRFTRSRKWTRRAIVLIQNKD